MGYGTRYLGGVEGQVWEPVKHHRDVLRVEHTHRNTLDDQINVSVQTSRYTETSRNMRSGNKIWYEASTSPLYMKVYRQSWNTSILEGPLLQDIMNIHPSMLCAETYSRATIGALKVFRACLPRQLLQISQFLHQRRPSLCLIMRRLLLSLTVYMGRKTAIFR